MEFSRQEYWSGLPFPSPGDLPNPGALHCRQTVYHLSHQGSPKETVSIIVNMDTIYSRILHLVQFSSVSQSCPTLRNLMNRSMPGLPFHHQLLEFTQTHVHRVGDAIQPSHPLSSPSPPALNPSQHQGLF